MKIIASDYDGTLNYQGGVREENKAAIKKWRENGNLFGIVTGRGRDIIKTMIDDNLEVDFMIAYNGADIYDSQGNVMKRSLGNSERLGELLPIFLKRSGDWVDFITPEKTFRLTYNDESSELFDNWIKQGDISNIRQFIQIQTFYDSAEEAKKRAKQLNEDFGDILTALINGTWINAPSAGINKATGVREYAELMSVTQENIYVIGDSYNDLDMIKAFNGFCVENGAEEIKNISRNIYKGVWELIEAYI